MEVDNREFPFVVIYHSMTGNNKRFIERLRSIYPKLRAYNREERMPLNPPIILLTYTTGIGEYSKEGLEIASYYKKRLIGIATSGNKNWGELYAIAGQLIAEKLKLNLPLFQIELSGDDDYARRFVKFSEEAYENYYMQRPNNKRKRGS